MIEKLDPIIAVKNVANSSRWYQSLFECRSIHGGNEFDVLANKKGDILLCLHKWGEHDHPTMMYDSIISGNGLIFYFKTRHLDQVRENTLKMDCQIDGDVHLNPDSQQQEFSLREPDGYYLTITEYHNYQGS